MVYSDGAEVATIGTVGSASQGSAATRSAGSSEQCDLWLKVWCDYINDPVVDVNPGNCIVTGWFWVCPKTTDGGQPDDGNSDKDVKYTPCKNILNKISDPTARKVLEDLLSKTKENYEVGNVLYLNEDGSLSYSTIQGDPGKGHVDITFSGKAESVVHSHYDGCDPIFTAEDCIGMFEAYEKELMSDPETFFLGLVTSDGVYFLSITDLDKFKALVARYSHNAVARGLFIKYYNHYKDPSNKIDWFAKFLSEMNTGMTLTTTGKDFKDVKTKEYNPNTKKITTKDC